MNNCEPTFAPPYMYVFDASYVSDLALGPGDTVPQARDLRGGVLRALMGYAQELWVCRRAHNLDFNCGK